MKGGVRSYYREFDQEVAVSGECAGRLAGGASAALAFIALIYANIGEVDVAAETSRWCGTMSTPGGSEGV